MIHGSWSCWSSWSSCSAGQRSRSRSCSNPSPQNGGQHCFGETSETSDCEDEDLEYLRSETEMTNSMNFKRFMQRTTAVRRRFMQIFVIIVLIFKKFLHRTWEPQCFDQTLPPVQTCGTPPALINGYVLVIMKLNWAFTVKCGTNCCTFNIL